MPDLQRRSARRAPRSAPLHGSTQVPNSAGVAGSEAGPAPEDDPAIFEYRRASGIDARLVVVGMASNGLSIADPHDPEMLDVVGFDTATPQLVSDFARGAL